MTTPTPTHADGPPSASALVIEDDDDVRELLATHLRRLGWGVRLAATGEAGVAMAFEERPDVVLLDVVLPGMDGRDVVRLLRGHPTTSTCAVIVTTVLDPQDLDEVPFEACLPKPFTRRDLARVLAPLHPLARSTTATAPTEEISR